MTFDINGFNKSIRDMIDSNFGGEYKVDKEKSRLLYDSVRLVMQAFTEKPHIDREVEYALDDDLNGRVTISIKNPKVKSVQNVLLEKDALNAFSLALNGARDLMFCSNGEEQTLVISYMIPQVIYKEAGRNEK